MVFLLENRPRVQLPYAINEPALRTSAADGGTRVADEKKRRVRFWRYVRDDGDKRNSRRIAVEGRFAAGGGSPEMTKGKKGMTAK